MGSTLQHTILVALLFVLSYVPYSEAQTAIADTSIVEYLERNTTGGIVKIVQPAGLSQRVARGKESLETDAAKVPVYRIQLFSSNNSSAKSDAEKLAEEVEQLFPDLQAVVSYVSPFWRLRVGDFRTYEEASAMQLQIQNKFPGMERGMLIIRERINMPLRGNLND